MLVRFQSVCVLGLGYIGLPTASTFAKSGLKVLGVDVDQNVLDNLNQRQIDIQEPGLHALVKEALDSRSLTLSDHPERAAAYVIAVPTPVTENNQADLSHVLEAAEAIVPHLREGNLVILESTCPPRTTIDKVAPILERSGLKAGSDFFLAYTPERALPGHILVELVKNARVIGGIDPASAEAGKELYATFVEGEILLTDATTAEMVKLMENTYRDVNIAVANEFSRLAEGLGVDVWEAIQIANRHPRVEILQPGPGVGGHCIAVDPWFLVEATPELTPLIQQAMAVNDGQPAHSVDLIERALAGLSGKRIAALGLSYKANVGDLRLSPALEIVARLVERGAEVHTFEPYVTAASVEGAVAEMTLAATLKEADGVVLLVNHREFLELDPNQAAREMAGRVAVDLRGAWEAESWRAAGYQMSKLGVGTPDA
ncbi:MAG: nucleotide sugar dehydrogenase [Chloroflexi bacterium]|nr:nucleotide sugar dehydrogenase [Chloroflexota bacterium]MCH8337784.1 nucleotide sugar dehydrogenase [Chloroflexota bacterium]